MQRFFLAACVVILLAAVMGFSVSGAPGTPAASDLTVHVEDRNPWTSLELNNSSDSFQFAVVTDRTGGRRPGVFEKAVTKLNMLQPEFVMSVGDLIQGYTDDPGMWALEWSEFESRVHDLQMPFFFCPGNHDISNLPMSEEWKRKFGRSYYDIRYRDVLFLVLNTEEKPVPREKAEYYISPEQRQWVADTLARNTDVRWTFLFMHKPTWTYPAADHKLLGWEEVEDALQGRRYTVFAGHKHQYAKYQRRGMEYYMLATTGGGSNLSGIPDGRFDHFVWVTMKGDRPTIANVLLDGVQSSDVRRLPDPSPAPARSE